MRTISPASRTDYILFNHLEDAVSQDNIVRLYDLLIDKLELSHPERFKKKGLKKTGRKAYSTNTLLKLLLYGYMNRIQGSRRIEKECYRNLEVMWLVGNLKPDHWTINDFRSKNGDLIKFVTIEFRKFLKATGYITGKVQATDGSKFKAYASRDMLTKKSIEERLAHLDQKLSKYLKASKEVDLLEDLKEEFTIESPDKSYPEALLEKIEKLKKEVAKLESSKSSLEETGRKYISPNDSDAPLVKGRDGKFAGYNGQTIIDGENKLISYGEVTTDVNDRKRLKKNIDKQKEEVGIEPEILEADKGFSMISDIMAIEEDGKTECFVSLQKSSQEIKDKKNGIKFEYNEEKDEYNCSQGGVLIKTRKNIRDGANLYDIYQGQNCDGCILREKCTKAKKGRTYRRNTEQKWIDNYKERLKTIQGKACAKERKKLVEHPFGTIKIMMGKFGFLLTGLQKVQIEFDLYTTAYNLKRMKTIVGIPEMLEKVANYAW